MTGFRSGVLIPNGVDTLLTYFAKEPTHLLIAFVPGEDETPRLETVLTQFLAQQAQCKQFILQRLLKIESPIVVVLNFYKVAVSFG